MLSIWSVIRRTSVRVRGRVYRRPRCRDPDLTLHLCSLDMQGTQSRAIWPWELDSNPKVQYRAGDEFSMRIRHLNLSCRGPSPNSAYVILQSARSDLLRLGTCIAFLADSDAVHVNRAQLPSLNSVCPSSTSLDTSICKPHHREMSVASSVTASARVRGPSSRCKSGSVSDIRPILKPCSFHLKLANNAETGI